MLWACVVLEVRWPEHSFLMVSVREPVGDWYAGVRNKKVRVTFACTVQKKADEESANGLQFSCLCENLWSAGDKVEARCETHKARHALHSGFHSNKIWCFVVEVKYLYVGTVELSPLAVQCCRWRDQISIFFQFFRWFSYICFNAVVK